MVSLLGISYLEAGASYFRKITTMASWIIDGNTVTAEPVDFADIKPGDEIIHLYTPDDGSGDVKLWFGVVVEFYENTGEWYGRERFYTHANDFSNEPFATPVPFQTSDGAVDVLIVAEWHGELDRHSLYRVVSDCGDN